MTRHLYVAVPTHSGLIEPATVAAINRSLPLVRDKGWRFNFLRWAGDGLIANARNAIVARFLASAATDLLFIDADVAWEGDELIRLAEHPVDCVAGIYRYKKEPESYPLVLLDDGTDPRNAATGLLRVALVPAGFLKLSRASLERMTTYYADRRYQRTATEEAFCLFDCGLKEGHYWGEDYFFCRRWRDIGGDIWTDPSLTLHHWGFIDTEKPELGRRAYSGCLGDWLKTKPAVKIEHLEAA